VVFSSFGAVPPVVRRLPPYPGGWFIDKTLRTCLRATCFVPTFERTARRVTKVYVPHTRAYAHARRGEHCYRGAVLDVPLKLEVCNNVQKLHTSERGTHARTGRPCYRGVACDEP
jgi:hypothetical protein